MFPPLYTEYERRSLEHFEFFFVDTISFFVFLIILDMSVVLWSPPYTCIVYIRSGTILVPMPELIKRYCFYYRTKYHHLVIRIGIHKLFGSRGMRGGWWN